MNKFALDFPFGLVQIVFAIGLIEGASDVGDFWFGRGKREPGDLGYDPLGGFKKKTKEEQDKIRLQELKNGRLAMIAMAAYTSNHWIPGAVPLMPGQF